MVVGYGGEEQESKADGGEGNQSKPYMRSVRSGLSVRGWLGEMMGGALTSIDGVRMLLIVRGAVIIVSSVIRVVRLYDQRSVPGFTCGGRTRVVAHPRMRMSSVVD